MRQSMLIIAVVCLGFCSPNILAQAPGTPNTSQTDIKANSDSDCPPLPHAVAADRSANARKCYQQGLELIERGRLTQAAENFRHAVHFDPGYADAYAALGRTYFKLRDWQKAIANLNRAASLKSKQREPGESKLPMAAEKQSIDGPTQPATQPQKGSIQSDMKSDPRQLKVVEAEVKTVPGPTPAEGKDSNVPEQPPAAAPVAMSVTPTPNVKESAGPTVSTILPIDELSLTKIYRVGPNDVLDVRLSDSGQQSTLYTVTASGMLEHPLFKEPMSVAGLTVEEIATRIDEDLRNRAIIENPKTVVGVRDYASHSVLVSGLVKDAGTKFLRREAIPLYVVVADAQPLPEAAKVTVVRNESNQIYEIDLNQAADMNFLVRPGDVITLSPNTTQFVYIGGEVKLPGEKTYRRGLTLMQVILSAGGLGPKAKTAEISRDDGNGFLVPTRFQLKEIVSGKAMDPVLKPGDRISILR